MDSNREEGFVFKQPRTLDERVKAASLLVGRLGLPLPLAVDGMDNALETAFAAWPERIYVLARGGRIAYKGGMGPFGFHPEEAEPALARLVAGVGHDP